ncbi:hypothetical protein F8388_025127 [Cannabis sativa]|uniref:Leucine-rich repeat-containing N-terminal plant-type domain-containing protein n=1 Tax=Cannabis sativa TaxID=3483 RepID=A0A7J6FJF7_CANSA|nr:hypothetical protein F8388_025127 [Cannabis sativa]
METPLLNRSIVSLFFLFFIIFQPSFSAEQCNPKDKRVLLRMKRALKNPSVLDSWDPSTDCCNEWNSVTCNHETHRVNSLTISGGLQGQIPRQIGDLSFLETLVLLKHRNLEGSIPPTISRLKRLSYLTISSTNISGPIPNFLGQMRRLRSIDLSYNTLSGPIPSSLALIPNLTSLHLNRNKLTGPIPASFGQFSGSDFDLHLSHNQLSGRIPASLGNKLDFNDVNLSRNRLEGDASFLFGRRKRIRALDLSRNMLQFELSKVRFPRTLTWLDLNHNRINGTLPAGWGATKAGVHLIFP